LRRVPQQQSRHTLTVQDDRVAPTFVDDLTPA
jgi:hypothetical protein